MPAQVGGFQIIAPLFKGGMSEVYRGRDPLGNLEVVVKRITEEHTAAYDRREEKNERVLPGLKVLEGLSWEGEIMAHLNHPLIVHLYEYGREDGRYYIVMEYLASKNLHDLNRTQSPLLKGQRLRIMFQFALALLHVHRMGILHRDICPRNILLDSENQVKLIDFGLAIPKRSQLKDVFKRGGTPSYMAPEVVRSNHYDFQTDVYAFGVSLYEVFTGQLPHQGQDEFDRVSKHLNMPVRPPREVNPNIPEALEAIILKAMEKEPAKRYAAMEDIVADLNRLGSSGDRNQAEQMLVKNEPRRVYERIRDRCYLRYFVKSWFSRGPLQVSVTENIGGGGIGFWTRQPMPEGTNLDMEIQPRAATARIQTSGRVAHVGPPDGRGLHLLGVQFTKIARKDQERFEKYIQERKASESPADGGRIEGT